MLNIIDMHATKGGEYELCDEERWGGILVPV